jgi:hypothetical protein
LNTPREILMQALFAQFTPLAGASPIVPASPYDPAWFTAIAAQPPTVFQQTVTAEAPFRMVSRILPPNPNIGQDNMPALYLVEANENTDQNVLANQRYKPAAKLFVVGWIPDASTSCPGTILNPLVDAFDLALLTIPGTQPLVVNSLGWAVSANPIGDAGVPQTLNGIVASCFLSGTIKKQVDRVGNQVWASASIMITTGE